MGRSTSAGLRPVRIAAIVSLTILALLAASGTQAISTPVRVLIDASAEAPAD